MAIVTSVKNAEDAVNFALGQIGYRLQIGSLYDGSRAAVAALAIYGQCRDDLMRAGNWQFASRSVFLTLLKSAPAGGYVPGITTWDPTLYPQQPWLYEYAYPDDCLKIRIVKPSQIFTGPNFNPSPYPLAVNNDNGYTPPRKTILSNVAEALCVYTGRVTDPTVWDANFTQTFIDELGTRLAPALTELGAAQMSAALGAKDENTAKMEQH
jgi:hypothetical protein